MNISKTWDVNPLDFMPKVEQDVRSLTVNIAEIVFSGIISRTPVYTGNLRASWKAAPFEDFSVTVGGSPANQLPPPTFPES